MTIKAVTFDFWQTLYTHTEEIDYSERIHELQRKVEKISGLDFAMDQFKMAVDHARDRWDTTWTEEHRTIAADEWLDIMLTKLEVELVTEHLLELQTYMENGVYRSVPALISGTREVLSRLADQYRLAIISDTGLTPGRILRQFLEADHLTGYFHQLTFSDEIGRSKPHRNNFLFTLEQLEVEPNEAVHVGDMLRTDIAGAKNVGMRAIQYTGVRHDDTSSASASITPDAVISHHSEIFPLLQKWNQSKTGKGV